MPAPMHVVQFGRSHKVSIVGVVAVLCCWYGRHDCTFAVHVPPHVLIQFVPFGPMIIPSLSGVNGMRSWPGMSLMAQGQK